MPTQLAQHLADAAARPFARGRHDCVLFAADWAHRVCGVDPAAAWRGRYRDVRELAPLLAAEGGLEAGMNRALSAAGWQPVAPAGVAAGDIVLAAPPRHPEAVAGLAVAGGRTALLTLRGLVVARVPVLRAWTWSGTRG